MIHQKLWKKGYIIVSDEPIILTYFNTSVIRHVCHVRKSSCIQILIEIISSLTEALYISCKWIGILTIGQD